MTTERWQHIDKLFHSVLQRSPELRAGFLAEACAGDESVRSEVEALIAAHERSGEFLDAPAYEVAGVHLANDLAKLIVGQTLGRYKILGSLGIGGMGEVYLAEDTRLGRKIALKLLPSEFTKDADRVRRFEQEARAASALNHPNILTIHEIGSENELRFIATEFIDGETLRHRIRQRPLKLSDAVHIAVEIAEALTAAHAEGIVHRDIKPENIMLRKDGHVKVLDFGLAKLTDNVANNFGGAQSANPIASLHTTPGLIMGTVAYMSPEQARGLAVDARTDIWSFGVVLYEMLAGSAPFHGDTPSDVIALILTAEPPRLAQHIEEGPVRLEQIVAKALRKECEKRYQSAKELLDDLKQLKPELEFGSQRERSTEFDPSERASTATRSKRARVDTDRELWTRTGMHRAPLRTASVQYLLSRITAHKQTTIIALVTIGLVVAAIGLGWHKFFSGKVTTAGMSANIFRQTQVTKLTTNGNPVVAAISPDGKYVAYALAEAGKQSLWLRQVDIASNHRIVPPADVEYQGVTFPPDGNYIYYTVFDGKNDPVLYKVPILGGVATKVIADVAGAKLSPDGTQIIFKRWFEEQQEEDLMIAQADGTGEQKLISSKQAGGRFGWWYRTGPAWSPDGKTIACAVGVSDASGPYMNVLEVRIADHRMRLFSVQRWDWIAHMAWLADGSGLIMSASDKESSFEQLWLLSYPDGEARRLIGSSNNYEGVSMTRDSSVLVTMQMQEVTNVWRAPHDELRHAVQITSGAGRYFDLSTTSDGKLLYASDTSGNAQVWEMEADGTGQKQLTTGAGRSYGPTASPDGRYIVFHSNRSGSITGAWNIWRMDRDGSNQKQLTRGKGEDNFATCSPDSKWVIYTSDSSGKRSLWKVPIDGGDPLLLSDKIVMRPNVSPDGKLIAGWYVPEPNSPVKIAVVPFAGGPPVKLFDIPPTLNLSGPIALPIRWTPDGRGMTYVAVRGESWSGIPNIWSQPFSGGKPTQLTDFSTDKVYSFDWARDGQLIIVRGAETKDVVLIKDAR